MRGTISLAVFIVTLVAFAPILCVYSSATGTQCDSLGVNLIEAIGGQELKGGWSSWLMLILPAATAGLTFFLIGRRERNR